VRRSRPEFAWRGAPGVFAYIFTVYQGRCFALEQLEGSALLRGRTQ
jgi:hypothetical protein